MPPWPAVEFLRELAVFSEILEKVIRVMKAEVVKIGDE